MEIRRLEQMLAMLGGDFLRRMHGDIAEELRDLEDFVKDQNKDAALTFSLDLRFALGRDGLLRMTGDYKLKPPKAPAAAGVAWLDDGALTPQNPAQRHFQFDPDTARVTNGQRYESRADDVIDAGSDNRRFAD